MADFVANKIDPRGLKTLLGILRQFGVTSYQDGTLSIQLADVIPQQTPADADADPNRDLELPDGVVDPVKLLEKINRRPRAS